METVVVVNTEQRTNTDETKACRKERKNKEHSNSYNTITISYLSVRFTISHQYHTNATTATPHHHNNDHDPNEV